MKNQQLREQYVIEDEELMQNIDDEDDDDMDDLSPETRALMKRVMKKRTLKKLGNEIDKVRNGNQTSELDEKDQLTYHPERQKQLLHMMALYK